MHVAATLIFLMGACVMVDSLPVKPVALTSKSQRDTLVSVGHISNSEGSTTMIQESMFIGEDNAYCLICLVYIPAYHDGILYIYERDTKVTVGWQQK